MAGTPKDHYVPQFYLDAFAIEGPGQKEPHIFQYMEDKVVSPRISDAASEKHFYTVKEKGTGKPLREVDDIFTMSEGAAAGPLQKILAEQALNLTDEEIENLSIFLGLLAVRTPGFIKGQQSMSAESMKELMAIEAMNKDAFKKSMEKAGIFLNDKELEEQRKFVIGKEYNVEFGNKSHFLAQGLQIAMDFALWYAERKHWHLLISNSDRVFLTSDNPISIYRPVFVPPAYNAGYGNGTLFIPIGPKAALLLRDRPHQQKVIKLSGARVDELNKNTMRFSDNYIFSNLNSKSIAETYRQIGKRHFQKTEVKRHKWAPFIFMGPPPVPEEPKF